MRMPCFYLLSTACSKTPAPPDYLQVACRARMAEAVLHHTVRAIGTTNTPDTANSAFNLACQ